MNAKLTEGRLKYLFLLRSLSFSLDKPLGGLRALSMSKRLGTLSLPRRLLFNRQMHLFTASPAIGRPDMALLIRGQENLLGKGERTGMLVINEASASARSRPRPANRPRNSVCRGARHRRFIAPLNHLRPRW